MNEEQFEDITSFEFYVILPFALAAIGLASFAGYLLGSTCWAVAFVWNRYFGFVLHEACSIFSEEFSDAFERSEE